MTKQPFPRTALLAPHGEGPRKGGLNKAHILTQMDNHSQLASSDVVKNKTKRESEDHLHEEGSLKEYGAGYTLYWSGKPKSESHLSGVGFMIKNSINSKLENLLRGHSVCIISLCLPLHNKKHVILFIVYAPTLQADPVEKDKFYTNLCCLNQKVPKNYKIIILGDFNARVAPTMGETLKAIQQVKTGKAAGFDGIPPEVWKHGGQALHAKFHKLIVHSWEQGKLPPDFCNAVIIPLHKKKGEKSDCSNFRGITLLSIAGKILGRILLNRLVPAITEELLPESQGGFRANRSTIDMLLTLSRKGLWQILDHLGCPPKFLKMIILLHEDQCGQVKYGDALSKPFAITNDVKQGCVLAPTLFTVFFSMMHQRAVVDIDKESDTYI
ncbi:hypothetical protein WISP_136332 [Willisornis vidua]|uniref:Reverse transcriptase domain-containing protein n=1 Tax=Willisornis vidua TaxID=1566151 RepID=A0ABQ9CTI1_9PASS|nr:hypothetical protein WISP_136332 [Willisornis vidua]